ncbi:MAG: A/G-specific adenine glycosylase [Eubacteriales bacterium]|nr:A/G-specific adenine glycosylase [Eubacteriales bacterium]
MKYGNITEGRFKRRPNRFIAEVEIQTGAQTRLETVHVKNTGRCRELLVPDAVVYLEKSGSPGRKTAYDLVAVEKEGQIVNMDSAAPNRAAQEWLASGAYFPDVTLVRPETVYKDSRFDFYVEAGERRIFLEVKGVTLEEQGIAMFPDAPSERAVKHVQELAEAAKEGYESYILFVIQRKGICCFTPNRDAQPAFAQALWEAGRQGVRILAYDCLVQADGMRLADPVEVAPSFEGALLKRIAPRLLSWYDENKRSLPWREQPTPYRVWVSEIMLQQTRVEAVKPYFARFMERLPDIASLARVEDDELLKLWEGLGYYSRARNLKAAACQIMEQYNGQMPPDYRELLKLKGIGSYTAGAVASIACGQPVPAVDGNVLRVYSRLFADGSDMADTAGKRRVEERLFEAVPKDRPGDFNQALMELGATVCLPNGAPRCSLCPWQEFCCAKREQTQLQYPHRAEKKPRRIEERTVLVIRDGERCVLRKRPPKGLLAGLYEFPSLPGHASVREVRKWLKEEGIGAVRIEPLAASKHIFSHVEWHMTGYMVLADALEPMREKDGLFFAGLAETEEKYPVPSAFFAYAGCLKLRTGSDRLRREQAAGDSMTDTRPSPSGGL